MKDYDFDFQGIVDADSDIVIVTKAYPLNAPQAEIVYVNKAFTELSGYTKAEVIGNSHRFLLAGNPGKNTASEVGQALQKKQSARVTVKSHTKTGHEYRLDLSIIPLMNGFGEVTHFVAMERDGSEQKSLETKFDELAKQDELTGLLNRHAFEQMINQEFLRYLRTHNKFAVLLIDIDNFKNINQKFGRKAGDQALINLANLFEILFRSYDHAIRLGGDEFCVVLPDSSQVKALISAERLRHRVEKTPLLIDDDNIEMTVSIGVAEAMETDLDYHEILDRADKALCKAKINGRNKVVKYIAE